MTQIIEVLPINYTWEETLSAYANLLESGSEQGKKVARERLMNLAAELDQNAALFEASPTLLKLLGEWLNIDDWQDEAVASFDLVERTKAVIEHVEKGGVA